MSEGWGRVTEIFHAALAEPADRRESFVAAACAGDETLAAEVRSLLAHHAESEGFLEPAHTPLGGMSPLPGGPMSPGPGTVLGAWRLVRPVGEGGMGTVWLAERATGQFTQRGALKLIRLGLAYEEAIRRFRRERQILASLDHPNIARLLDGGSTPEGLPYLVMEYVEGEPLYAYCSTRGLSVVERLRLFVTLCSAVHDAHRKLVIHRDLKPGNVMVTGDGSPKLLDFGVAKIFDTLPGSGEQLRTVELPFTPLYASPEQLRSEEVGTASDIYSLGVLLYELLTGMHPYPTRTATPAEVIRTVLDTEPLRPSAAVTATPGATGTSTGGPREGAWPAPLPVRPIADVTALGKRLAGDLDNIVLKTMNKDPARRYASVEHLKTDVERYLDGRPVEARGDSWSYRAGKFVRRNRVAVAAGALALLALIGGLVVSLWQASVATHESALARQRLRDAHSLANTLLFDVYDGIENMPGATAVRAKVVEKAAIYLDALSRDAGRDSSLRFSLADAYERLGTAQGQTHVGDAGRSYQRARTLREDLQREYPDNERVLNGLIQVYTRIGALDEVSGHLPEALALMQEAAACNERLLALHPDHDAYRVGMYKRYNNLGNALTYNHRYEEALTPLRKAMDGFASLAAADTASVEWRRLVGMSTTVYGQCLLALPGKADSALAAERRALFFYTEAARRQPDNTDLAERVADAHERLGSTLALRNGPPDSALAHIRIAQSVIETAAASDPKNQDLAMEVDLGRVELGLVLALDHQVASADRELETVAPKIEAWWRADTTDDRLFGARPTLLLGMALVDEDRARAGRGADATRAWREAHAHVDRAHALFVRDSTAAAWDLVAEESRLIAETRTRCDQALAATTGTPRR
ncbi:MAG: protein kinase [Candidatus Eisenbacteria bacterium]